MLGLELSRLAKPVSATFFFTHVHWDHIQGFPFFVPAFKKGNSFRLYGPRLTTAPGHVGCVLEKALRGQQEDLNFPVQLKDMPADMDFRDLENGESVCIHGEKSTLIVENALLHHPGGCFGYRFTEKVEGRPNKTITFCTDTEHLHNNLNPSMQFLAKDADMLVYDCQYTSHEYEGIDGRPRHGWGHSTWENGLAEARAAGVKHFVLFHHDPLHDDEFIAQMEEAARQAGKRMGIKVTAARQMETLEV